MMDDRRTSRRFDGKIGIISSDEDGLNFGFITDLSREGAYIETQKVLPKGTRFNFVLSTGSFKSPISSKVVRTRDAFFEGGTSGFGIFFEELDSPSKKMRDDLLLYLMNQYYQSKWQ